MKKLILSMFILFISLTLIGCGKKADIDHYIVHYNGNDHYDIETLDDHIQVKRSEIVECFQAPCDPVYKETFNVDYTEDYIELIKGLFRDVEGNEITVNSYELTSEEVRLISTMVNDQIYE